MCDISSELIVYFHTAHPFQRIFLYGSSQSTILVLLNQQSKNVAISESGAAAWAFRSSGLVTNRGTGGENAQIISLVKGKRLFQNY